MTEQIFLKRSLLIVRGFVCERTDSFPVAPISITCDVRANLSSPFSLPLFPSSRYVCSSESKIFPWNWYRRSGRKLHFVWPEDSPTCYPASRIYRRLRRICRRSPSKNLSGIRDRFRDLSQNSSSMTHRCDVAVFNSIYLSVSPIEFEFHWMIYRNGCKRKSRFKLIRFC